MAKIKLAYFDFTGRAEVPRILFKLAGIEFEDERLSREEFAKRKPTFPFECVPVLEVDGKVYAQSGGIKMYAAKLAKMYPEDPLEILEIEQVRGALQDVMLPVLATWEMPEEAKLKARGAAVAEGGKINVILTKLNAILEGRKFAAGGDKMSLADLELYHLVNMFSSGYLTGIPSDIIKPFPNVAKAHEVVSNNEVVKKHVAESSGK